MSLATVVYTDGACSGNPGPGGWAWVVPGGRFASGAEPHTTNQRMELRAVLEAAEALDGDLEIMSDSTYVVNCFRDRWWEGWLERGWRNSQKKPVANRDLWQPLIDHYQRRKLGFTWVRGHAGDEWNDLADRLAVEAASRQEGRSGEEPPADVGRADVPTPRRSPAQKQIAGHALLVVGHRPPELGGYGETPLAAAVRARLEAVIAAKSAMHDDLVVVTGLNLGVETLAAEAAQAVGVPYVVVLAHPGQDDPWPTESKRRFSRLQDNASEIITLQKETPATKQRIAGSYRRRDGWVRKHVDEALAVWDGSEEYVGRTVRSLQDELGEEDVWIIDPTELI